MRVIACMLHTLGLSYHWLPAAVVLIAWYACLSPVASRTHKLLIGNGVTRKNPLWWDFSKLLNVSQHATLRWACMSREGAGLRA